MDEKIMKMVLPTPFSVGDVNVYLVKGDSLTLVDAGVKTEVAWETFKQQLKEVGYEPRDIEQVVLTHHHPDHVGLLEDRAGDNQDTDASDKRHEFRSIGDVPIHALEDADAGQA